MVVAQDFSDGRSGDVRGMALAFGNLESRTRARFDALYEEKLFEAAARVHVGRALGRLEQ